MMGRILVLAFACVLATPAMTFAKVQPSAGKGLGFGVKKFKLI